MHSPNGIHNRCVCANRHKRRPCDSQETHTYPQCVQRSEHTNIKTSRKRKRRFQERFPNFLPSCGCSLRRSTLTLRCGPILSQRISMNLDMVLIPEGWFWMGSDHHYRWESPRHRVWLDAFEIGRFAVRRSEYGRYLSETAYPEPAGWR